LLNTNSYQKAGWFLHMLRQKLGDETFFNGLRNYYARYRNSTALTSDFRKEMEKVSGKDLTLFFDQWLLQAGHPAIRMKWVQEQEELLQIEIIQTQLAVFDFPLEIQMLYGDGSIETKTVQIDQRKLKTDLSVTGKVQNIKIDPNIKLLFEDISESAQ
jgi:aminopeptidase N